MKKARQMLDCFHGSGVRHAHTEGGGLGHLWRPRKKISNGIRTSEYRTKSGEDSVTFRDPETSSLKTSFQEKISLRNATGISHLRPSESEYRGLQQDKKPT